MLPELRRRERGIARKRVGDPAFAAQLAGWLDQLLRLYGDRLLPMNVGVARRWGQLSASSMVSPW